jgi:hypothetical protein
MREHRRIQGLLYEYLRDELEQGERHRVEEHLARCGRCVRELHELRSVLVVLTPAETDPSGTRSGFFWETFAARVEQQVRDDARRKQSLPLLSVDEIIRWLGSRRQFAISTVGAIATVIVALVVWTPWDVVDEAGDPAEHVARQTDDGTSDDALTDRVTSRRVSEYFRRSKVLLVGLTNVKDPERSPLNAEAVQEISRELVYESRYLQQYPIDQRSARLMNDVERILLKVANSDQSRPAMDVVRGGIRQENLLFKLRMAESAYSSPYITTARYQE